MLHPHVTVLAERQMTALRITGQAAAASRQQPRVSGKPVRYLEPPEPGPGEWACRWCGGGWFGTPPDDQACLGGCLPAA